MVKSKSNFVFGNLFIILCALNIIKLSYGYDIINIICLILAGGLSIKFFRASLQI